MKRLRCAIYTRKSSEEGLEQDFNSLHAQREACEAYVLSQTGEGWTALKAQYDDGGISGGTMERPGLKALLADIAAGRIDVVLVYKLDRLTRSLMDFMKIVEVFDRHEVSFVSVTQSFNTTSSMGRLTLNMLLSFAQFEREVTSERIRDKLAASKKKGLWMGGNLPLGYDADGRTLRINEAEAEQVRHIFARYLELKSVHRLAEELAQVGIFSKQRTTKSGSVIGGGPMRRGALFYLLSNKVYIGQIPHKELSYPGQHRGIVDLGIFEAAQLLLAGNGQPRRSDATPPATSPLTGKLYDADGVRMSPVSARGKNNRGYRYYVSGSLLRGGKALNAPGARRLPAIPLEALLRETLDRLLGPPGEGRDTWARLERVDLGQDSVQLTLDGKLILLSGERRAQAQRRIAMALEETERVWPDQAGAICVAMPMRLMFRGGKRSIVGAGPPPSIQDRALGASLRRAHQIAGAAGLFPTTDPTIVQPSSAPADTYARRIAAMAFLAPDIQRAIILGEAPHTLSRLSLMKADLPTCWNKQRQLLGFANPRR